MSTPWEVDDTVTSKSASTGPTPWETDDTGENKPAKRNRFLEGLMPKGMIKSGYGALETATQMATAIPAQALGGLRGLATIATGGGLDKAVEASQGTADALTYSPRTLAGKELSAATAIPFEAANEGLGRVGEAVGGNVGRTIGESAIPVAGTVIPGMQALKGARAAAAVPKTEPLPPADMIKFARENAGKLEALELAKKHGIAVDPSVVNPTTVNRALKRAAGAETVSNQLAKQNLGKWEGMLKDEVGIPPGANLNMDTLKAVREASAGPMMEIRKLGTIYGDEGVISAMEALRPEPTIGGRSAAAAANRMIDEAIVKMQDGMSGDAVMTNIQQLRKQARDIYKMQDAGPARLSIADTSMKIANKLEELTETDLLKRHQANPYAGYDKLMEQYHQGRTRMAKTYALEDVTDLNTMRVDPVKLAKLTASDNSLTGAFSDMGKIAANFPESVRGPMGDPHSGLGKRAYRTTVLGGLGAGAGAAVGGPVGAMMGAMGGTLATDTVAAMLARALTGKGGQRRAVAPVPEKYWRGFDKVEPYTPYESPVSYFTP